MFRALETLSEPVIMMKDRVIVSVNAATVTLFGYADKGELEGKPVTILMPPTQATAHDGYVDKYETTGERKVIGKPRGVRMPVSGRHVVGTCGLQAPFRTHCHVGLAIFADGAGHTRTPTPVLPAMWASDVL
jgi:PAS domain S-box-containing protein